ncbi:MAG TPA: branched-chain amino acid ABC transporter permease [Burkholderiales bacterium]|nr:branched-chain amino acid ABC transporter permease [Burkholderiales bacterium]
MSVRGGALMLVTALAALLLLPFVAEKFYVQFATKVLVMAIFAASLNLLVGYTGLVSLGHAAFFGIAGYLLALVTPQYEAADLWSSLLLAVGAAALLALVVGALVVRTSGIYFIMATLAFAQMLYFLFHDTSLAGGSDGIYIYVRPQANIGGWRPFDLENFRHLYFVVLAMFVLVLGFLRALVDSPFGRVIAGIRVNEQRMRALGFATFRYKLVCFVIGGALAGLAGYLSAVQFGVVNPDMLGWHLSGSALMMVILGGMGTLPGPVLGAVTIMLLELGFQSLTKHWQLLMGAVIVLVALALPQGLAGLVALPGTARARDDG